MSAKKTDIEEIVASGTTSQAARRWLIGLVIAGLTLGGGSIWIAGQSGGSGVSYEMAVVERTNLVVKVTATGSVEPTNLVEISSELSGTIQSVAVDHNSVVSKGQILAELNTEKLKAQLEHTRASLTAQEARVAQAQATLTEAQSDYDRALELDRRGVTTTQSFLAAKAALSRAKAAVASAEADVRVAAADLLIDEANLNKACICSPIDGVVLERNVDVGQIVASAFQAPILFSIAEDLTRMELRVDIDEADIGKVEVGNEASFTVEAYQDRAFPAVISELRFAPQTIDGVVTYEAILSIDNADLLLRPGMTATAEITVAQIDNALTLSNAAIRFSPPVEAEEDAGGSGLLGLLIRRPSTGAITKQRSVGNLRTIWTVEGDALVAVEIETGETNGVMTEITAGSLREGDRVVVDMATK